MKQKFFRKEEVMETSSC